MELTRDILDALSAPFSPDELEFLPRGQSNGKAMALPYIDARSVMRRLDATVGPANWSFDFDILSGDGKMVRGRLTVLGVTKCDAGESNAEDEPLKSAVSDALKRAAVHFGIGRYLYYLPRVWAPFDSQKRRFSESPRLDPAVVRRALAICGVHSHSTPALEAETVHEAPPAPYKSNGGSLTRNATADPSAQQAPESSGDRVAARMTHACSGPGCTRILNQSQLTVSRRKYGVPLCPHCQSNTASAKTASQVADEPPPLAKRLNGKASNGALAASPA